MNRVIAGLAVAVLFAPLVASASFADSAALAKQRTDQLTQQQLDATNAKLFSDAFLTAKIIGYDRAEIDQLKADVQALKDENAELRAMSVGSSGNIGTAEFTDADLPSLDARVTKLEGMFAGLQNSLVLLINMVSEVLNKLK